jgi:uncharacterized glyoxalase superfamily protein PhnB
VVAIHQSPRPSLTGGAKEESPMNRPKVTFKQVNIVAKSFDATLEFYRLAGLEIPEPMAQPPGALHVTAKAEGGVVLEIDNEHLGRIYNAGVRSKTGGDCRTIIGITVESRQQVDDTYARLVAAGHQGRQRPYDAFWGSRYAVVADPEGNDVGLMSPPDEQHRSWPPTNSPEE